MGRRATPPAVRAVALPALAALLTVTMSGCSGATAKTAAAGAKHAYTAGFVTVQMTFPSTPRRQHDPAGLTGNFPAGTSVTAWTIGSLGQLPRPHSFELAIAVPPASTSDVTLRRIVSAFAGAVGTTLFGHPAGREIDTVDTASGVHYAGVVAVIVGRAVVLAACYDKSKKVVTSFIGSLGLLKTASGLKVPVD